MEAALAVDLITADPKMSRTIQSLNRLFFYVFGAAMIKSAASPPSPIMQELAKMRH